MKVTARHKKSRKFERQRKKRPEFEPPKPDETCVCGECGAFVKGSQVYMTCPITGRRTSAKWCQDCFERALARGRAPENPVRRAA